jgi:hypothetical protein
LKRLPRHAWRALNRGFLLIAEPRVVRLVQFGIYLCMIFAGHSVLTTPPSSFESVLGLTLINVFGGFVTIGGILAAIAVLPGIWWLERAGILALMTGMAMYSVIIITLGVSPVGLAVAVAFVLTFVQRWMEIRRFQLAPKRG